MKTDLKVELFLIHQTYFADNHAYTGILQHRRTNQKRMNMVQKIGLSVCHKLIILEKKTVPSDEEPN